MRSSIPKNRWGKRAALLFAVVLLTLGSCVTAFARANIPEPSEIFYVADYANVLTQDTVDYIVERNEALEGETGAQIVVATVDFLGGYDIEEYALEVFNSWGIGDKEKNNGVLLLLAIGDDNYWAMQGRGLESVLTSGKMGDLLYEYLEEDFAAKDYDAGVKKVFDAFYDVLVKYYGAGESSSPATVAPSYPSEDHYAPDHSVGTTVYSVLRIFGFVLIIAVILAIIIGFQTVFRPRRTVYRPPYYRTGRWGPPMGGGYRPPPPPPGVPPVSPPPPRPKRGFWDDFWGGSGGGSSRGGGAGRSTGSRSFSSGSSRSFGGSRSSGGGRRSGGGGSSRGGGAGRGR